MSGLHNGVQALVKKEAEHCLYVHCFGHSLNQCVQEVTKRCDFLRNAMEFIFQLDQLIEFPPKRLDLFESIRQAVALNGHTSLPYLRTLCPTRWTVRHGSINSYSLQLPYACHPPLTLSNKSMTRMQPKPRVYCCQMKSFDTFFGLKLALSCLLCSRAAFSQPTGQGHNND